MWLWHTCVITGELTHDQVRGPAHSYLLEWEVDPRLEVEGCARGEHELALEERLERPRPPALPSREHVTAAVTRAERVEIGESPAEVEEPIGRRGMKLEVRVEPERRAGGAGVEFGRRHERPARADRQVQLAPEEHAAQVEVPAQPRADRRLLHEYRASAAHPPPRRRSGGCAADARYSWSSRRSARGWAGTST